METGRNRAVGSLQSFRGLDLTVRRRLDGLLHGEYGGVRLGPGSDAEELARYQPGHDVRRIDWKVTARARQPHLWLTQAQHERHLAAAGPDAEHGVRHGRCREG